jgi:glyoxylate reductase
MSKKRILVLGDLPGAAMDRLARDCWVDIRSDGPFSQNEMGELVQGYDGLLTLLTQEVGKSVFEAGDRLLIIANYAVGVDNIDLIAARDHGVVVTNTPDVLTDDTADLTWALILAVVRNLWPASQFLREERFEGWNPGLLFGRSIRSLTLGVVGAGRIGQAVLKRAESFGVEKLYTSRGRLSADREVRLQVEWREFSDLLRSSDVVSLHLPLDSETHHLLDESALRSIPEGGFLINTARGPLVDEAALVRVLRDGHLAGAGLDVFEREPKLEPGLKELENVILLPHIGSATPETRLAMADCCVDDLLAVLVSGRRAVRTVV